MLKVMYLRPEPPKETVVDYFKSMFSYAKANKRLAGWLALHALALLIVSGATQPDIPAPQTSLERCRNALLYPVMSEMESGSTPTLDSACLNEEEYPLQ